MTLFSKCVRGLKPSLTQWLIFGAAVSTFLGAPAGFAQTTVTESQGITSARDSLNSFNRTVQQASGTFIQTVISPNGRVKQEGEGLFAFAKPGQFRWETLSPFPQLIVSNGASVVTYDPDLEQASRRPAANAMDSSPSALLFGYRDLDRLFKIVDEGKTVGGTQWLQAIPLKGDSLFNKIRVGMRDGMPREVEIYDSLGQVTRLALQNWNIAPELSPQSFEFEVPQGVDMIEVQ